MKHTYSIVTEGDFSKQVYTVIGDTKAIVFEYTDYGKPVPYTYDGIAVRMTEHHAHEDGYYCPLLDTGCVTVELSVIGIYPVGTMATMIERGDPVQYVLKRIEEICL